MYNHYRDYYDTLSTPASPPAPLNLYRLALYLVFSVIMFCTFIIILLYNTSVVSALQTTPFLLLPTTRTLSTSTSASPSTASASSTLTNTRSDLYHTVDVLHPLLVPVVGMMHAVDTPNPWLSSLFHTYTHPLTNTHYLRHLPFSSRSDSEQHKEESPQQHEGDHGLGSSKVEGGRTEDAENTAARGILQSQGDKPPESAENVHIPSEKMQYIRSHLQHRKEDIERNMMKSSDLATMDTSTSAAHETEGKQE